MGFDASFVDVRLNPTVRRRQLLRVEGPEAGGAPVGGGDSEVAKGPSSSEAGFLDARREASVAQGAVACLGKTSVVMGVVPE